MATKRPIVWVANKAGLDYSDASRFGDVRFLSKGWVNLLNTNEHYLSFVEQMEDAGPDDYLLISSATTLCILMAGIQVLKFGVLNLLMFVGDRYIERNIDIASLVGSLEGDNVSDASR